MLLLHHNYSRLRFAYLILMDIEIHSDSAHQSFTSITIKSKKAILAIPSIQFRELKQVFASTTPKKNTSKLNQGKITNSNKSQKK